MNYIKNVLSRLVQGKQKALAAFAIAAVSSFIARHGLTLNASSLAYLQAAVIGAIAHVGVYLTSNKS